MSEPYANCDDIKSPVSAGSEIEAENLKINSGMLETVPNIGKLKPTLGRSRSVKRLSIGFARSRSRSNLLLPDSPTKAHFLHRSKSHRLFHTDTNSPNSVEGNTNAESFGFQPIQRTQNKSGAKRKKRRTQIKAVPVSWDGTPEEFEQVHCDLQRQLSHIIATEPKVWGFGALCGNTKKASVIAPRLTFPLQDVVVDVSNNSIEFYQRMLLGNNFHWKEITQVSMTDRWEARIRRLANVEMFSGAVLGVRHLRSSHAIDSNEESGTDTNRSQNSVRSTSSRRSATRTPRTARRVSATESRTSPRVGQGSVSQSRTPRSARRGSAAESRTSPRVDQDNISESRTPRSARRGSAAESRTPRSARRGSAVESRTSPRVDQDSISESRTPRSARRGSAAESRTPRSARRGSTILSGKLNGSKRKTIQGSSGKVKRSRSRRGGTTTNKVNPFTIQVPWSERRRMWQCPDGWEVQVKYIGSFATKLKALRAAERALSKRNKGEHISKGQAFEQKIDTVIPPMHKCELFCIKVETSYFSGFDVYQRLGVIRAALLLAIQQIPLLARRTPPIPPTTTVAKIGVVGRNVQRMEMLQYCPFRFTAQCTVPVKPLEKGIKLRRSSRDSRRSRRTSTCSTTSAFSKVSQSMEKYPMKVAKTLRAAKRNAVISTHKATAFTAKQLVTLVNSNQAHASDEDEKKENDDVSNDSNQLPKLSSNQLDDKKPIKRRTRRQRSSITKSFATHFANLQLAEEPLHADTSKLPDIDNENGRSVKRGSLVSSGKYRSSATSSVKHRGSVASNAKRASVFGVNREKPASPQTSFVENLIHFTNAARILQRYVRERQAAKTSRLQIQRIRRIIDIQRWNRGLKCRAGFAIFRKKTQLAAIKVQSFFRMIIGRSQAAQQRMVMAQLARKLQPIVRGFLARKYVKWLRYAKGAAMAAQRITRGFITRTRYKRKMAEIYHYKVVLPAILRIQCMRRSLVARRLCDELRRGYREQYVEKPACILIQSVWRRKLAWVRVKVKLAQNRAAIVLQKNTRTWLAKRKLWALQVQALEAHSATLIAALVRGHLSRMLARLLRQQYNWLYVVLPTICRFQAKFRQRQTIKAVELHKKQTIAAPKIQRLYRKVKAQEKARSSIQQLIVDYRHRQATRIQCAYRSSCARQYVKFRNQQLRGARMHAAVVIQKTWRLYRDYWNDEWNREDAVIIQQHETLDFHAQRRSNMVNDIDAVDRELSRLANYLNKAWKYVRQLKATRVEWERRIPVVEKEMEELTEQDVERGWAEAYELEWDILTNSMGMIEEELLSKRLQIQHVEDTRDDLQLEKDDIEVDMDEEVQSCIRVFEAQHRMQIHLAHKALAYARRQAIYYQASRWKVTDRRVSKLTRKRKQDYEEELRMEALNEGSIKGVPERLKLTSKEVQSVQFKVIEQYKRKMETRNMVSQVKRRLDAISEVRKKGKNNAVLKKLANDTHLELLEMLRKHTYDMRNRKNDSRSDPNHFCQTCGLLRYSMCKCSDAVSSVESEVDSAEEEDRFE